jgi:GNAT superfamily N-acetyltransferase
MGMAFEFATEIPSAEDYWKLFQTTGWNDQYKLTASDLHQAVIASWYSITVYAEGKDLIGFGRLVSDGVLHAMIYELMVAPGYQNLGIGTQILTGLVNHCCDHHIRDIQLFCAQGKRDYYEKRGFVARPENAPGMQFKLS